MKLLNDPVENFFDFRFQECSKISNTSFLPKEAKTNNAEGPDQTTILTFPVCYSDKHFMNCSLDNLH